MKQALTLSLSLGVVCALAASVLAFANKQTKDAQEAAELRVKNDALGMVLPDFDNHPLEEATQVELKDGRTVTFYPAIRDGERVAYAAEGGTEKGYGGALRILVGLEIDGTIRAVVVSSHSETPGLGTQATDRKRTVKLTEFVTGKAGGDADALPPSKYLDQYTGKNLARKNPFALSSAGGTIDAVSGATITSQAVLDAVNAVAQAFRRNRDDLVQDQE